MKLLLLAATHGVEEQSSYFVNQFVKNYRQDLLHLVKVDSLFKFSLSEMLGVKASSYEENCTQLKLDGKFTSKAKSNLIVSLPVLNPHGLAHQTRSNANDVDLNRNLPSKNWASAKFRIDGQKNPYYPGEFPSSEIETQILCKIIEAFKIELIMSFHTNHFIQNENPPQINYDGTIKHKKWAKQLAAKTKLPFTEDIGYPTPGSLGSYSKEKNIDCITVEFDDKLDGETISKNYQESFLTSIQELFPGKA